MQEPSISHHIFATFVGTVGTGSNTLVVSVVLLPSANVCVTVTGDGDMLNPGVLVSIVVDGLGLPLARANEVVSTLVGPVGVTSAALTIVDDEVMVLNGAGGVKAEVLLVLVLVLVLVSAAPVLEVSTAG